MFSERVRWDLGLNRISAELARRRRAGSRILDLTESNPTRCGFDYPSEALLRCLSRPEALLYEPHPRGAPGARQRLARLYAERGATVPADHLVLTSGTSEAYSFLFRLLADPGDTVLVPAPSYPLLELLARINDVTLAYYPLSPDLDFAIDLEALAGLAGGRTRAVVVINPGNPTGAFLKHAEAKAVSRICREHGIALICDEVFSDYPDGADPDRVTTMASETNVLTFVLDGLSKMLGLPQLKLAWIALAGPPGEADEAVGRLEVIADTYLSVNTPAQVALGDLLGLRGEIQGRIRARLDLNRSLLDGCAAAHPSCRAMPSEGGWSAILQVPRTRSDEDWALRLLEVDAVLVHPGYFYNFEADGHLVLSLLPRPDVFAEGIERLLKRISADA